MILNLPLKLAVNQCTIVSADNNLHLAQYEMLVILQDAPSQ